jgi:hypothetical protein
VQFPAKPEVENPTWRLPKTEVLITFERKEMPTRYQQRPPYFLPRPAKIWHCQHGPTSGGIDRHRPTSEIKMAATQTGSGNNFITEKYDDSILTTTPTFSTLPDSDVSLSTWPDIGRHREHKMAATQTGSRTNFGTKRENYAISTPAVHFQSRA